MSVTERAGVVTFKGGPLTLLGPELAVGEPAPDFTAVDGDLNPVKRSDYAGKTVVIAAVPSLDTPVCAVETKRFNEEAAKLSDGVVVVTISLDLPFAQGRFCQAEGVDNVKTLSDYLHREFGTTYGVMIKELGLLARAVFVVAPDGALVYQEIVPEVTDEPDYEAALAAVRQAAS